MSENKDYIEPVNYILSENGFLKIPNSFLKSMDIYEALYLSALLEWNRKLLKDQLILEGEPF